jgi:hypothetical protein
MIDPNVLLDICSSLPAPDVLLDICSRFLPLMCSSIFAAPNVLLKICSYCVPMKKRKKKKLVSFYNFKKNSHYNMTGAIHLFLKIRFLATI